MRHRLNQTLTISILLAAGLPASLPAQTTFMQTEAANTFVSSASPTMNYGTQGAMEIAAATTAQNNTDESLLQFSTAAMLAAFNSDYGTGNWVVTGIKLELFSNMAMAGTVPGGPGLNTIAAGGFELDWLSNNTWTQSGITWNGMSAILPGTDGNVEDSLGDFTWAANTPNSPESSMTWTLNVDPNMVNNIDNGTAVTIFGQPTASSTVGYLFNTLKQGNPAVLDVTVEELPEPGTMGLMVSGLVGLAACRRRKG
jgi:hypothetical protein